jgi:hypothetical protein
MSEHPIFTVGGTVQAGSGIYLPRPADDELLTHCLTGDFCYVLTARQMGKSSLMVRTAERLNAAGTRTAIIDLTRLGTSLQAEQWYLGLVDELVEQLALGVDYKAWWQAHAHLGATQRLSRFLRETVLEAIDIQLVIFIDEIDTTLSLTFADDFFAAIRACYNARSTDPAYKRLSFVLLGVATPSDLIRDPMRTPFNIGQRIDLTDFTLNQALPLADGLGLPTEQASQTLVWVLDWTSGHPYLTQRLCRALTERNRIDWDEAAVAQVVEEIFFVEQGKQEGNLHFVRDMLTSRAPDVRKVLAVYKMVLAGKRVKNDEQSQVVAHLKISGVVCEKKQYLVVRNRIYEHTFNLRWVRQSMPHSLPVHIAWATSAFAFVMLMIIGYFGYQELNRPDSERAAIFQARFKETTEPNVRIDNLAGLLRLSSDTYYAYQARYLFFGLSVEDQRKLFEESSKSPNPHNVLTIVQGIYPYLDDNHDNNDLLLVMSDSITREDPLLSIQLSDWVHGREKLNQNDFDEAEFFFNHVLTSNNPMAFYDHARANIGQHDYLTACNDLTSIVAHDIRFAIKTYSLMKDNLDFRNFAENNQVCSQLMTGLKILDISVWQETNGARYDTLFPLIRGLADGEISEVTNENASWGNTDRLKFFQTLGRITSYEKFYSHPAGCNSSDIKGVYIQIMFFQSRDGSQRFYDWAHESVNVKFVDVVGDNAYIYIENQNEDICRSATASVTFQRYNVIVRARVSVLDGTLDENSIETVALLIGDFIDQRIKEGSVQQGEEFYYSYPLP